MQNKLLFRCLATAALGAACLAPAMAQNAASPAARDAQGHAAPLVNPTTPSAPTANPQGVKPPTGTGMGSTGDHGMKKHEMGSGSTPMNTTPGAGLRNSGNTVPPTSGAAGR